ncbi:MAG: hypothetical protein JNK58_03775 [Phycisphaerae bacterium]|nr:hypothetical protein [Phycisphaerae bacterium]
MLIDLLTIAGGEGAELLRRWVAALMNAPPEERRGIVEAVEKRIVDLYHPVTTEPPTAEDATLHLHAQPIESAGITEVVVRSFAAAEPKKQPSPRGRERSA